MHFNQLYDIIVCTMKDFNNLKFNTSTTTGLHTGTMLLTDNMTISIIGGDGAYGDGQKSFEVCVIDNINNEPLTISESGGDVLGWQSKEQIDQLIKSVIDDPGKFRADCDMRMLNNVMEFEES